MSNYPSPRQYRMALASLDWDNKSLSEVTGINVDTINDLLRGKTKPHVKTIAKITSTFEGRGIEFLENDGVRLRPEDIDIYRGVDGLQAFSEFMYAYLAKEGGDVCVSVTDERQFGKYRLNPKQHTQKMINLVTGSGVTGRILASDSENKETWAKIRIIPKMYSSPVSFYVFGNYLALISFEDDNPPYIVLHKRGGFSEIFRQQFNLAWESAAEPA